MSYQATGRSQQGASLTAAPKMFLSLADEGELPQEQRSLPRKAFVVLLMALSLLAAPLYLASSAQGAAQDDPQAVLVKASEDDDESDEDDEPDTTGNNDTGTGRETAAANTDQPGLETGASTAGETDADHTGQTETGQTTGRETAAANTDRSGLSTGVSTRGETDPGDDTGQTERR